MRYPIYEMLTEGRDAPLYHATNSIRFMQILQDNELLDKTKQEELSLDIGKRVPYEISNWGTKLVRGVSLTRDFRFAKRWQRLAIIIELDQRKLAQTHKIIAYDYFSRSNDDERRRGNKAEAEEFVIRLYQEPFRPLCNKNLYQVNNRRF